MECDLKVTFSKDARRAGKTGGGIPAGAPEAFSQAGAEETNGREEIRGFAGSGPAM